MADTQRNREFVFAHEGPGRCSAKATVQAAGKRWSGSGCLCTATNALLIVYIRQRQLGRERDLVEDGMLGVRGQPQGMHFLPRSDPGPGEVLLQGLFSDLEAPVFQTRFRFELPPALII